MSRRRQDGPRLGDREALLVESPSGDDPRDAQRFQLLEGAQVVQAGDAAGSDDLHLSVLSQLPQAVEVDALHHPVATDVGIQDLPHSQGLQLPHQIH
jgi:hypothetical protein